MAALTLDALFASPDHYLHSFDGDEALFVPMNRAAYRRSIFLDNRIEPAARGVLRVPVAALQAPPGPTPATGWIFHIAHCGSTLLARALGELSDNLVLREPLALRQLGLAFDPARLALVLRMLARRYPGGGPNVVKANVPVNFILPQIAAAEPAARAVLLYFGLRDYALAILRSDGHRQWLREITVQLAGPLGDLAGLDDGERAAALWHAQMRRLAAALTSLPGARTLDAEDFFAAPESSLLAAARWLGVEAEAGAVAALARGPLFATYSKNPGIAFANADRLARRRQLETALAPELASGARWLERNAPEGRGLADELRRAALAC